MIGEGGGVDVDEFVVGGDDFVDEEVRAVA